MSNQEESRRWLAAIIFLSSSHRGLVAQRVELRATALFLAVRLHEARVGHLPDSLQALVPDTLDEIPADPFKETEPLRFDVDTNGVWRIWSVGANGVDDGGAGIGSPRRGHGPDVGITSDPTTP